MPVTTYPSPEHAGRYDEWGIVIQGGHEGKEVSSESPVLQVVKYMSDKVKNPWEDDQRRIARGLEISDGPDSVPTLASSMNPWTETDHIVLHKNGFIDTVNEAFANDLHLVLRPDDVWLAIMTQFNVYVNGRPEELRHLFVKHAEKKDLVIEYQDVQVEFGDFAQRMTTVVQEHIVDPAMESWIIPSFSTTTDSDKVVASYVMMASMQNFFGYGAIYKGCGFPSVTLLGEKSDWEDIGERIYKLADYGEEPDEWSKLLTVVVHYMIRTFDEPEAPEVKDFWMRASHFKGSGGSGLLFYSGWISAFSFWGDSGERLIDYSPYGEDTDNKKLTLDGVKFPMRDLSKMPISIVSVPVTITDDPGGVKLKCTAMAGTVGMRLSQDKTQAQPFPAWCVIQESIESLCQSDTAKSFGGSG